MTIDEIRDMHLPIKIEVSESNEYVVALCEEYNIAAQGRSLPEALERFGKMWRDYQVLGVVES